MKNKKGFTLLEVTIVAGLMAMVGVYMMQMTSNLNKTISRMETKSDEQEMMYITTLALTDKFACQRTLGNYCEDDDGKFVTDSDGNYIFQRGDCVTPAVGGTWVENGFRLDPWDSTEEFSLRNINADNSIDIAKVMDSSALHTSKVAKIYNRNYGLVFKACRVDVNMVPVMSIQQLEVLPNLLDNAYAISSVDPSIHTGPIVIPDCDEKLYYVGNSLLMKKFFVANYPEDQGGVPSGGGVGKVKFVFEYARLKEKGKIMRKSIDLYVNTNTDDEITTCLSANDVETFAADSTYVLEQDFNTGNCRGTPSTCPVSTNNNCTSMGGGTRCYMISCADGDELINGDSIAGSRQNGIQCDLALAGASTDRCTPASCVSLDGSFSDSCPAECRRQRYNRYECREYDSVNNLVGVRVICARRYSN